jgi:three-Cys-motif partner protein
MSWEIKEHTKAKHTILKNYLGAWFPIMAFSNPKIVYIDGFAGPGRYLNGEDGSPIYALKIAKEIFERFHQRLKDKTFVFLFIEADKEHYESLMNEIKCLDIPKQFKILSVNKSFENSMKEIFSVLDDANTNLAPSFAFIDPFGTKGIPFEIVKKIMSYPKCEVFINHMVSGVTRSQYVSDHSSLYGSTQWINYVDKPGGLTYFYSEQLKNEANVLYTRSFEVRNRKNAPIFDLIYATNNLKGLEKMKEAMWKADPSGNFVFRDKTNPDQLVLFELEPDLTPLKNQLLRNFAGKTASIEEIERYVLIETPFLKSHIRQKTLAPLEKKGVIQVSRPNGSRKGFIEGTKILFPVLQNVCSSLFCDKII